MDLKLEVTLQMEKMKSWFGETCEPLTSERIKLTSVALLQDRLYLLNESPSRHDEPKSCEVV